MFEVAFVLMCVGCSGLAVLFIRLSSRISRLEKCLLTAAERLGEAQHE